MLDINLTNSNFDTKVLESDKIVMLDFFSTWCAPCNILLKNINEVVKNYEEYIKVYSVNVEEQIELATRFNVASLPTLIIFKNGEIVKNVTGVMTKKEIEEVIKNLI